MYNPEKQELIGVFSQQAYVRRYLFPLHTDKKKVDKIRYCLLAKKKIENPTFPYAVALRFANPAQREFLGNDLYKIVQGYPLPLECHMIGFVNTCLPFKVLHAREPLKMKVRRQNKNREPEEMIEELPVVLPLMIAEPVGVVPVMEEKPEIVKQVILIRTIKTEVMQDVIIAVDFDGTLVEHEYPRIGRELDGAADVLKEMLGYGVKLCLNTIRDGIQLEEAVEWCMGRGIDLWGINENPNQHTWNQSRKMYATIYIDDAALGCPLISEPGKRPYVDWVRVREHLVRHAILAERIPIMFAAPEGGFDGPKLPMEHFDELGLLPAVSSYCDCGSSVVAIFGVCTNCGGQRKEDTAK